MCIRDRLNFINEQNPAGKTGSENQTRRKQKPLQRQVFEFDGLQRVGSRTIDLFQTIPDAADRHAFTRPEIGNLVDQFRIVVQFFVQQEGRGKDLAEAARRTVGPFGKLDVLWAARLQSKGDLCLLYTSRCV